MDTKSGNRLGWVDVSRAIAMIFVYLGHWVTVHVGAFAYGFHLQLFFLVAGFFAFRGTQKKFSEWIKHEALVLLLPYALWSIISFIFNNLDQTPIRFSNYIELLKTPWTIQPNYWFFPAFIAVVFVYYFIAKIIKKPLAICILAFILHVLFGETPVLNNNWLNTSNWLMPFQILNNWISITAIPQYLFWYSFGSLAFKPIQLFVSQKDKDKCSVFYIVGMISGLISILLFFCNINNIGGFIGIIINYNAFTYEMYKIICCCIIIIFILFISKLFEDSKILNNISRSSMNFMGLEYITHSIFPLMILPMINLGIPSITSTMHVIIITIIQIAITMILSNIINKYIPVLNGNYKAMKTNKANS